MTKAEVWLSVFNATISYVGGNQDNSNKMADWVVENKPELYTEVKGHIPFKYRIT